MHIKTIDLITPFDIKVGKDWHLFRKNKMESSRVFTNEKRLDSMLLEQYIIAKGASPDPGNEWRWDFWHPVYNYTDAKQINGKFYNSYWLWNKGSKKEQYRDSMKLGLLDNFFFYRSSHNPYRLLKHGDIVRIEPIGFISADTFVNDLLRTSSVPATESYATISDIERCSTNCLQP